MRKSWVMVFAICSFFFLGLAPAVSAAGSPKLGYFDLQTVLDKSKAGQRAKKNFEAKQKTMKAEVESKSRAFKKLKQDFDKKQALLDDKAKRAKINELRKAQAEGEQLVVQTQQKLGKLSQELTKPIVDKILELVRKAGKQGKYDLIFEVQKGGIAYAKEDGDLTNQLIKDLNKVMP